MFLRTQARSEASLSGLRLTRHCFQFNGESGRKAAAVLKRLIHAGDLDQVSVFLEKVKLEGGVA